MGEQPCLWSTLDLKFNAHNGVGDEHWDWDPLHPPIGPVGWTKELKEVLNTGRLKTLNHLTLDFIKEDSCSWEDFMFFLHIIPPTVQKLSLPKLWPIETHPMPPFPVMAKQLVEKLDKFEEVDFGSNGFLLELGMAHAVLRTVSAGRDSKLRILSMPGFAQRLCPDVLAEARKTLTVNLLGLNLYLRSDSDDEDGDEENVIQIGNILIEHNQKKGNAKYVVQQYLQEVMGEEKNEDKIEDTMSLLSLLARCLCLHYYRILLRLLEAPK